MKSAVHPARVLAKALFLFVLSNSLFVALVDPPVGKLTLYNSLFPGRLRFPYAPIVPVNEPIFVADGQNHDVRYNGLYPRWAYDHYRDFMLEWAEQRDLPWLDYWNALPREDFADANFHRRESGEECFARLLAPDIQRLVCS